MSITTKVEFAFGANLTANPATWTWVDVSIYALGSVTVIPGRPDEASQATPTRCELRLRNIDARFSPRFPTSPYYPNVRRQTPVRVSLNPGTGYVQRFQGYVDQFLPNWPSGNSDIAEVAVTASGILRRLGQGSSPAKSALYRAISQSGPVAYWSLEDAVNSTQGASGLLGGLPMTLTAGRVAFAGATGPASSAPLVDFSAGGVGGTMAGNVPPGSSTTAWRVEFVTRFNGFAPAAFAAAVQWQTTGSVAVWEVDAAEVASGGLSLQYIDSVGAFGGPFVSNIKVDDGGWHHVRVDASQSGGNIALTVKLDGTTVITQTLVGLTMGSVSYMIVNPTGDATEEVPAIGHVAVWAPFSSGVDTVAAWQGYVGETAGARIARLCAENSIPASVSSTTGTASMGPQTYTSLLALLRECEAVDDGILYDGASAGLTYLAAQDRYNSAVALALDCQRQQVKLPFVPVEDDQRVRNDWTVTRTGGSSARVTDPVHIAANGLYDSSVTLNVQGDGDLLSHAAWLVHKGTTEEMRVPGLSLQLIDRPELWSAWLAATVGSRATAANLPVQYPPGILDVIIEGYAEIWDAVSWKVDPTTSPFAPWRIFQIAADSGDLGEFVGHLDTDGSSLHAGISARAQGFVESWTVDIAAGYPLWTVVSDDLPFDIGIEGERITVTAISGSSSPQAFTVKRAMNGVVKAHSAAAVVSLWAPLVLGL